MSVVASVGYNIPVSPVTVSNDSHRVQAVRQDMPESEPTQSPRNIRSTTAALEQIGQAFNKKLQFVVDQNSNQVIVKVIDKETDKVIKELPPEELQRLNTNLQDTIGFLFNEFV